ncbi:MAG: cyclopropane-fatty-acyl-phospholipid synthase [Proteobacteria bacterium]|nr:cyclopropane-fatty-acyl-phospholipid synthase [Pseudomonadota bacterium]
MGDGDTPRCTVRIAPDLREFRLLISPPIFLAEALMDGKVSIEEGSIGDLLEILLRNYQHLERHPIARIARIARTIGRQGRRLQQYNPLHRARQNVAHHYDLGNELYDLFLDDDRQYSCAYFETPDDTLEDAQFKKKRHIAAKLLLDVPGLSVLDIGSGWGGMALYLAQAAGCTVEGLTLSTEQQARSSERAATASLSDRVHFHLRDYREETRTFDRIVSVGMFEHVGKRHYREFFDKIKHLLNDDGVCLLHSVGRFDEPAPVNPFIRKYIFPGTDIPALSEVMAAVEKSGLFATDIEVLRLHYAETLSHWRARFNQNRDRIAALYDERFCRMWDLYLTSCELGFRYSGLMVFQIQLTKQLDAVPRVRDYMVDWERAQTPPQMPAHE